MRGALETIVGGGCLDVSTARAVMDGVMEGSATPGPDRRPTGGAAHQGERPSTSSPGMVMSMRDHATPVELSPGAVDTCGTGGDGSNTFNISTAAALVAAAAGCRVAKHGNRAQSSRCGSADVLEELGVRVVLDAAGVRRCVDEAGIGFIFAPAFHPAMRHAAAVRRELGIRTVFNVLGPLANPARVRHQALGVAGNAPVEAMARVLQLLGHQHALVFTGPGGIDELGLDGVTRGFEVTESGLADLEIDPQTLGLRTAPPAALGGGDAATNARIIRGVLDGDTGPPRDVVVLNGAAALVASGRHNRSRRRCREMHRRHRFGRRAGHSADAGRGVAGGGVRIALSTRLRSVGSLIPPGTGSVADVGAGHGALCAGLAARTSARIIATEISAGPLGELRANLSRHGR